MGKPRVEGDGLLPAETTPANMTTYKCNPWATANDLCYIHPDYKAELDCACGIGSDCGISSGISSGCGKGDSPSDDQVSFALRRASISALASATALMLAA